MNPSLLLIPDRYKKDKLYSQIPDSGDGDLTFARNSNATRVNSAGLIEKVRTNLLLQSQTIDNASWIKSQLNTTGTPPYINVAVAPDGTLTADKIIANTSNAFHNLTQSFTLSTSGLYTVSAFIKAAEESVVTIRFRSDSFVNGFFATFNLITNTFTSGVNGTGTFVSGKIEALADGWFRVVAAGTIPSGSSVNLQYELRSSSFAGNDSDGLFIWGAQLETGDIATDYIPTTTAAVSVGITADIPRLDYTGGGCPSLLLEPQRTNLVTFSEQFNNAGWSKLNSSTITANTSVSPSGYQEADKFQASNLAFGGILRQSPTVTSGAAHTFSFFCKKDNYRYVGIRFNTSTIGGTIVPTYDFDTNTFNAQGVTGVTLSSQLYANGWVRLILTFTSTSTTGLCDICIVPSTGNTETALTGTEAILVWGAQLEVGSYVSSYIPTLGSSVTRLADQALLNNSAALPTAYPFTLFADFDVTLATEGQAITFLNSALSTEYFSIDHNSGFYRALSRPSSTISLVTSTVPATVGFHKICGVFTSTTIKLFVDGVLVASGANAQAFNASVNDLFVGQLRSVTDTGFRNSIKQALIFKSELTDNQAIELTA